MVVDPINARSLKTNETSIPNLIIYAQEYVYYIWTCVIVIVCTGCCSGGIGKITRVQTHFSYQQWMKYTTLLSGLNSMCISLDDANMRSFFFFFAKRYECLCVFAQLICFSLIFASHKISFLSWCYANHWFSGYFTQFSLFVCFFFILGMHYTNN